MKYDYSDRAFGFNPEIERLHRDPEHDWQFGGFSTLGIGDIPSYARENYLPMGEVQQGKEDMMDCASRGPLNILEAKFTYAYSKKLFKAENMQWLKAKGYVSRDGKITFSDAFVAINSGTTPKGNSLKAPLEAIRKQGLVPKNMLPLESWMTFNDFHNPNRITPTLKALGEEFKNRFQINYEQVAHIHFKELLKDDLFIVGVHAWPQPTAKEYPKTDAPFNHVVAMIRPEYYIFDNYEETKGDFIKKLAPDFSFWPDGYRIFISKDLDTKEIEQLISLWQGVVNLYKKMIDFLVKGR